LKRTEALTILAKVGIETIPTAIIVFSNFGPKTATIPIARSIVGKASIISINLIIKTSHNPPKYPEINPKKTPRDKAKKTDINPTVSEILAP